MGIYTLIEETVHFDAAISNYSLWISFYPAQQ